MRAVQQEKHYTADLAARSLRSGGHKEGPPGVFIASGPDIAKQETGRLNELRRDQVPVAGSVLDIAPTVLTLLGLPVGRDMDGKVLEDVIEPSFLTEHPVSWVEAHTPPDWHESRSAEPKERLSEEERLEQLRSLGYIE